MADYTQTTLRTAVEVDGNRYFAPPSKIDIAVTTPTASSDATTAQKIAEVRARISFLAKRYITPEQK